MSTRAGMIRRRLAAQRGQDAVAQLKARLREPLRARLEASAKVRGVSLNTELVDRLEQSFAREDSFGGSEMANMARLMAAAFLRGGQRGAHARGHPKLRVAQWIDDPSCFDAGVAAVVHALSAMHPKQLSNTNELVLADRRVRAVKERAVKGFSDEG